MFVIYFHCVDGFQKSQTQKPGLKVTLFLNLLCRLSISRIPNWFSAHPRFIFRMKQFHEQLIILYFVSKQSLLNIKQNAVFICICGRLYAIQYTIVMCAHPTYVRPVTLFKDDLVYYVLIKKQFSSMFLHCQYKQLQYLTIPFWRYQTTMSIFSR